MAVKKGIVIESKPGWAILLLPGGEYRKIKTNRNLQVGQEYRPPRTSPLGYGAAAAIFILVLFGVIDFFSIKAYARLESGVELGINRWDRVVSVDTENEAIADSVEDLRLAGKPVETAVRMLMDKTINDLESSDSQLDSVTVEVSSKDRNQSQTEERILNRINQEMNKRISGEEFAQRKAQFEILRDNKRLLFKSINNSNQDNIEIDATKQKGPVNPVVPKAPTMNWQNNSKEQETVKDIPSGNQTILPKPDKFNTHEEIKNRLEQRWQERREIIKDHREQVLQKWQQKKSESKNSQEEATPVDNANKNKQNEQGNENASQVGNTAAENETP